MMRYMVMIYNNAETTAAIEGGDRVEFRAVHGAIQEELAASGELIDTNVLSVADARVVRTGGGETTVTTGPFSEGREFAGGWYVLECATIDRAVDIAARFVEARYSPVEVRAFVFG